MSFLDEIIQYPSYYFIISKYMQINLTYQISFNVSLYKYAQICIQIRQNNYYI